MARLDTNAWRDAPLRPGRVELGSYAQYLPDGLGHDALVDVRLRAGDVWTNERAITLGAYWRRDDSSADIVAWRPAGQPDYALHMSRDEAVLLAATLGAHDSRDHRVTRGPDVVASGQHLFDVLAHAFRDADDWHELSRSYGRHFDGDDPHFPNVELSPADEPDLPAPTGYVVLRRRPVPGDTVWPRWLEPAPGSGERNALAAARTVHDVDRDDDGNVRVWVGPDRTDGAYVWRDDRQRYVLTGFDVDLLSDDRYVRPWHDVRPGQTVAVVAGLDDPRPDEYCVTEVDRHVSGRVTGIRVGHDDDFYRPDDHDRFAGPYVPEVKLVWPR